MYGVTVGSMMVCTIWIRNKDMAFIYGVMDAFIKGIGLMENKKEEEDIYCQMVLGKWGCGKMVGVSSG